MELTEPSPQRAAPAPQHAASPAPRLRGGFAVLGVRTSGLSPLRARMVEVAVVLLDPAGARVRSWATLVDPHGAGGAPCSPTSPASWPGC